MVFYFQCGNPGVYSTTYCIQCFKFRNSLCMLCRMPGHIQKFCPDLWRRYHLTVKTKMTYPQFKVVNKKFFKSTKPLVI